MARTNVAPANLTALGKAVTKYQDLFHHRSVLLEAVRKVAYRNMAHVVDVMDRCEPLGHSHAESEGLARCGQRMMLNDQGLEITTVTLWLTGLSTIAPMNLYLALLYAEIDYFQNHMAKDQFLQDAEFTEYLSGKREWMRGLKGFRDQFLHPRSGSEEDHWFLQDSESINGSPDVQDKLDAYLERCSLAVHSRLKDVLSCLYEVDRLKVLWRFAFVNVERLKAHRDAAGIRRLNEMVEEIRKQVERVSENPKDYEPDQDTLFLRQDDIESLVQWMNVISPSREEWPIKLHEFEVPIQPPMAVFPFTALLPDQTVRHYGNNRHTAWAVNNRSQIRQLLLAAFVLQNEVLIAQVMDRLPSRFDLEEMDRVFSDYWMEIDEGTTSLNMSEMACEGIARLLSGVLYEPLRVYAKAAKGDPLIWNERLSKWIAEENLYKLRTHRNSVFHVKQSSSTTESGRAHWYDIITGLSAVYGFGDIALLDQHGEQKLFSEE